MPNLYIPTNDDTKLTTLCNIVLNDATPHTFLTDPYINATQYGMKVAALGSAERFIMAFENLTSSDVTVTFYGTYSASGSFASLLDFTITVPALSQTSQSFHPVLTGYFPYWWVSIQAASIPMIPGTVSIVARIP